MKKKILIIDDDQLILYGLQKALRQETVEVTTAPTATDAETELSACPYDLCLLDIHLPDYNGLDLMKIITHICPNTKVIIMTASYMGDEELSSNIKQAADNGACHFITKPFDLNEVKDIIHQALYDENFHTGVRFSGNAFVKRSRKYNRQLCSQQMDVAMINLEEGQANTFYAEVKSVDISDGGVGLVAGFPLKVSQVISMKYGSDEKIGIVVWSTMLEDSTYRAGVRFA